jgi:hypothetical protein
VGVSAFKTIKASPIITALPVLVVILPNEADVAYKSVKLAPEAVILLKVTLKLFAIVEANEALIEASALLACEAEVANKAVVAKDAEVALEAKSAINACEALVEVDAYEALVVVKEALAFTACD